MPKRALVEKRPWLLTSLAAATAFYLLRDSQLPGVYQILLKGAGVALLAVYALARHRGRDSHWIAAVMALGALGDMVLEIDFQVGAALFLAGHAVAISLYLRHPRKRTTMSQKGAALALLIGTPLISWLLPADRGTAPLVALYALGLGGMAASAWMSSFPRYRLGLGAVLFVISDLLIFARMGPLAESPVPDLLVWPTYYIGQLLICIGVVGELYRRHGAPRPA